MPILIVNGHRIFEQDEVGSTLAGYSFALDINTNTEAEKIAAERIVFAGTEVDSGAGYQQITGRKFLSNRLLEYQPNDIASANNLILTNGRFFRISDTANEIQTISNFGWTGGSWVLIEVKSGQSIQHNAANFSYDCGILLAVQADYVATQDLILQLVYDRIAQKWKEVGGTSVAMVAERNWYVANKVQAFCEQVDATSYITIPDVYSGYTVTNAGTASFHIVDNRIEFTSTGTAYMIQFWDGSTLVDTFPLSEAPRLVSDASFIPEMRSRYSSEGVRTGIVNSQGYTTQDEEFYTHFYGLCRVSTSEYIIDIPNLSDGNIQEFLK